jgi:hypothetical protein
VNFPIPGQLNTFSVEFFGVKEFVGYYNRAVSILPYRLLQISSFNGKMNALNEVNKVIASVTYYPHRHTGLEEEEWLTAERMAVSNSNC